MFSLNQVNKPSITHKRYIQLSTLTALIGLLTVAVNTIFNIVGPTSTPVYAIGFALMFVGTLWKAVLEMNSED